jgi:predicted NBD/HSP70 family sugar kinase
MATAGGLFRLIRDEGVATRAELAARTGIARSTVSQRVERLLERGFVVEAGEAPSSGGRPPTVLKFNQNAGVILAADLGATHCRIVVTDLAGEQLVEHPADLDIAAGPERVLPWVLDRFDDLLAEAACSPDRVRGIGVGLPGPVEFATGRAVNPPIMPGWDGVDVPAILRSRFEVPVFVDNDVNVMALGEYWSDGRAISDEMLFIKVGTGIGAGIISNGQIHRGAQGAAGDIGHIRLADHQEVTCRCGNRGCVEALAGGGALARQLREVGLEARGSRDIVDYVRAGEVTAVRLVRDAGRMIGEVLAGLVNFHNPSAIVVGGDLANADDQLLAGIREVVYQRSTALATRHLQIRRSRLGDRAGATGAAVMVLDAVLSADAVDAALAAPEGTAFAGSTATTDQT